MSRNLSSSQFYGAIVLAIGLAFGARVLFTVLAKPPVYRPFTCVSQVKQIGLNCIIYAGDYDNLLPKGKGWMDALAPYAKAEQFFHDVYGVKPSEYGYAYRNVASGMNESKVKKPEEFELVFDSTLLYRSAVSGLWSLPRPGRHGGNDTIGFLDGHVKARAVP